MTAIRVVHDLSQLKRLLHRRDVDGIVIDQPDRPPPPVKRLPDVLHDPIDHRHAERVEHEERVCIVRYWKRPRVGTDYLDAGCTAGRALAPTDVSPRARTKPLRELDPDNAPERKPNCEASNRIFPFPLPKSTNTLSSGRSSLCISFRHARPLVGT